MFLEVSQLQVRYAGQAVAAVQDVSLGLAAGQIGVLIGPSGCGKTTLLRSVAGLEPVAAGTIRLGSQVVGSPGHSVPPEQRRIGMVFQDYALFPHLSVGRNVAFGIEHLPAAERSLRVAEVLQLVGLEGSAQRYPHELSGGQQQRAAIARTLAMRPKLILLDEPTSALDPELVGEVLRVIRQLAEEGNTMILVTHEMQFAREVSHKILFLHQGKVEEEGAPAEIFTNPRSERMRQFLARTF